MLLSERTEQAIEACYDAALMPGLWPLALQQLGESLGAESCTFSSGDAVDDPVQMPRSEGHEAFAELWIRNEPHAPDPHVSRRPCDRVRARSYILEEDVSDEHDRRTLPYYQETARPQSRDWWAAGGFVVEGRHWCLPLYRSARRGPFTVEEALYFVRALPHLSRVIGLAGKLADAAIGSGFNILERLGVAAMVLDREGRARDLNDRAAALLGPDFCLSRGRPTTPDRAANRRLQALVAQSVARETGEAMPPAPAIIPREGAPWLLVEAMPVTGFGSSAFAAGRCVLILTDLTSGSHRPERALGAAFALTPAEARLSHCIARGIGIDEAAASLGIGRETARSQLKAAFAKTGTHSQAALAALIGRVLR